MSYEGWEQCICSLGHYYECDCWNDSDPCPDCGAAVAWQNSVDQTNGPSQGAIPVSVLKEKFLIREAEFETCNLGHQHLLHPALFRIPTRQETDPLRVYQDEEQYNQKLSDFIYDSNGPDDYLEWYAKNVKKG